MSDTSETIPPQDTARIRNAKVRVDRSRPFSTVHGERPPGDPHSAIFFFQDGIPFSAEGIMLPDLIDPKDEKLTALAERMQKRANAAAVRGDAPKTEMGEDEGLVNLTTWLRGEARYPWPDVTNRIAAVYKKRVNSIKDAVEFLVEDAKIVPAHEVGREFQKHVAA